MIKFAQALEFSAEAMSGQSFKKELGATKIESAHQLSGEAMH